MATIGTFSKKDDGYTGTIRTMTINVKSTFVPNDKKGNDKAPDFRVYAGGAELGAAWWSKSKDRKDYLSVELDDPSFAKPIRAAFFINKDERNTSGALVWSRTAAASDTSNARAA